MHVSRNQGIDGWETGVDTPLRRWRVSKGYTQADAGKLIGVQHAAWSKYERGLRIPHTVLQKLHRQTGLSYDALMEPERYLQTHPNIFPKGARALQTTPGYPKGVRRKRKIAEA
jgi:transcriptional regulator with XRE-family HTH domain